MVASFTAVVLLTWLYLLAGNLESEYHHRGGWRWRRTVVGVSEGLFFWFVLEMFRYNFYFPDTDSDS